MNLTNPTIVMMTDFGVQDTYVGVMKGVIHQISPTAHVIDLTHHIPPQSVSAGAWALKTACRFFAPNTIFLAIVDPDVGSQRQPIAVRAGEYTFVAPDNGLLTYVLRDQPMTQAVSIENRAYALPIVSATFHGRDIFAPAAAHLAAGVALEALGPRLETLVELPTSPLTFAQNYVEGTIIHIDHFGNIITNIEPLTWQANGQIRMGDTIFDATRAHIQIGSTGISGIQRAYYEVAEDVLLAQIDSSGALEVAVYKGNAQQRLDAAVGDSVVMEWQ